MGKVAQRRCALSSVAAGDSRNTISRQSHGIHDTGPAGWRRLLLADTTRLPRNGM